MTLWLREIGTATVKLGPFVDQTDGFTAETGLTISQADVRLSKNGGNMAQKNDTTACTHDELGYYDCPLNATDLDTVGTLRVMVHKSGALPVWQDCVVIAGQVWDSFFGVDKLWVDAIEIHNDVTAAANLEAMFDGTGYAGGTTMLNVNVRAISTDVTVADELEAVLKGTSVLGVNAYQIGNSTTAAFNAARGFQGLVLGTAVTGTLTTTAFTTSLSEATNDHYNGRTLTFTSGALAGQMTTISDYNGATKTVTVAALTEAPANGDLFFIA